MDANDPDTAETTVEETKQLPAVPTPKATLTAGARPQALVPTDFEGAWRIAVAVCTAKMAPRGLEEPEKSCVVILHGLEVGLTPMQALQSIAMVNGRPTIYGDGAIGLVRGSGRLEWMKESFTGSPFDDDYTAICVVKRRSEPEPMNYEFSVTDAKTAKLWGKKGHNGSDTPWITYPKRMLQMRARAFALRDNFADVLKGLAIKEEMDDLALIEATPREEPPTPTTTEAVKVTAEVVETKTEAKADPVTTKQAEVVDETKPEETAAADTKKKAPTKKEAAAKIKADAKAETGNAPNARSEPEAFVQWVDKVLAQVTDPDRLLETYEVKVTDTDAYKNDLMGCDQDECQALYRKHEQRLAP